MSFVPAKKNTAYICYVGLPSQANPLVLQANPTLAAGDVKICIDDGDPANLATIPVVDANFTKRVKVSLSSDEMNGDNITFIFSDAAGDEWCDVIVNIQTAANQIDDIKAETALIKAVTDALTTAAATKIALSAGTMVTGTVSHDNTAATTTVFYSDDITEATADHYNSRIIIFTSGALQYQATDITDYSLVSGEGKFSVGALTEAPADNVTFIII